jgi:hypothetical protein
MRIPSYINVLKRIPKPEKTPVFNKEGKLIICLVEYRIMDEIDYVINAMLRVYDKPEEIGFAIVFGKNNDKHIRDKYGNWGNIQLINTGHDNLNRGTYSALLKTPQLWENFTNWSNILIYQTDALLIRKIDTVYFQYDYIGSPWSVKNQWTKYNAGNGGFSLRNVKSMIRVCEPFRKTIFDKIHRGNEDGFFSSQDSFKYPPTNSLLHSAFAVERVKHLFPVGCHQIFYCWEMNNNEWKTFLEYIENNLINNKKTLLDLKTIEDASKFFKTEIKDEQIPIEELIPDVNVITDRKMSSIVEVLNYKYHVGPFDLTLKNEDKNCWNINCKNDYEILFCKKPDHLTNVETNKINKIHTAVVHKKDKGVQYYIDKNDIFLVFFPGFPEGGKSNCDVHAPWGTNFNRNRNLPNGGAVILKTHLDDEVKDKEETIKLEEELKKLEKENKNSVELETKLIQKYNLNNIKGNIFNYELFSGIGYYNQLFSLELGIYLAYISKRYLIINIKHPLVQCGKPTKELGPIFDYITDNYKEFLKYGYEIRQYEKCISTTINEINVTQKMSNCVIIDDDLNTPENKQEIDEFAHFRQKIPFSVFKDKFNSDRKIVSFNKSNAARIFNNFYTTKENYDLMNKIAITMNQYNPIIDSVYKEVLSTIKEKFIAIHLRFGDYHKNVQKISTNNNEIETNLTNWLNKHNTSKMPLYMMTDRKDNPFFNNIKKKFKVVMLDELINKDQKNKLSKQYKNTNLAEFLIQKRICEKAEIFIGSQGSTVSTHIQYNNYLNNKEYELHTHIKSTNYDNTTLKFKMNNKKKYTWAKKNYLGGHPVAWSMFFEDNINK